MCHLTWGFSQSGQQHKSTLLLLDYPPLLQIQAHRLRVCAMSILFISLHIELHIFNEQQWAFKAPQRQPQSAGSFPGHDMSPWEIKQMGYSKTFPPNHERKAWAHSQKGSELKWVKSARACELKLQKEPGWQLSPTVKVDCLFCQPCLSFLPWFLSRTTHHTTPRS